MDTSVLAVLVTAGASVLTTVLALLYGPAVKNRFDTRRARENRSEELLARYSEPLARAAFDLQSRLYNICQSGFATSDNISEDYRIRSTQWLFGQFLAWVEIVRREVQVIDYGDLARTAELQRHLFDVSDIFAASTRVRDPAFRLYRVEQRAIGELMVVERSAGRSDSMGYAEFVRRMEREADFARWFEPLSAGMAALRDGGSDGMRLAVAQRALIDLIDFFDPEQIRFPDFSLRGKILKPLAGSDGEPSRLASQIARFRYGDVEPFGVVDAWAARHRLAVTSGTKARTVRMRGRYLLPCHLHAVKSGIWVELHVGDGAGPASTNGDIRMPTDLLTRARLRVVNELLRELGRPVLVRRPKRLPGP